MSEDKKRFSARCEVDTVDKLDELADKRGLNRSQAVETITREWADLTDSGELPPELVGGLDDAPQSPTVSGSPLAATLEEATETANETAIYGTVLAGAALGMLILLSAVTAPGWLELTGRLFAGVVGVMGALHITSAVVGTANQASELLFGDSEADEQADETGADA